MIYILLNQAIHLDSGKLRVAWIHTHLGKEINCF